jgi:hypothetical protein
MYELSSPPIPLAVLELYRAIAVIATCPRSRSGRDRESNPSRLRGTQPSYRLRHPLRLKSDFIAYQLVSRKCTRNGWNSITECENVSEKRKRNERAWDKPESEGAHCPNAAAVGTSSECWIGGLLVRDRQVFLWRGKYIYPELIQRALYNIYEMRGTYV